MGRIWLNQGVLVVEDLLGRQHLPPLRPASPARSRPLGGAFSRARRCSGLSFDGGWLEFDEFRPTGAAP
jgi:hypothetical protein